MKNIPRIFLDADLTPGASVTVPREVSHYLANVMRQANCLVFNNGVEYNAHLSDDKKSIYIESATAHVDPSNNITLYFAPIKRMDDMLNMATQMGVARFVPVITARTVANHINWDRMRKIIIEASEQSNRNSVPSITDAIKFNALPFQDIVFADERAAYGRDLPMCVNGAKNVFVGPEGGFSDSEFEMLDKNGARGMSLGKTILRAELAAVIAINGVM